METEWILLDGIITAGHKIASGQAPDSPYPAGSIKMQKPFFHRLGLDLDNFFEGTLNISIRPYTFRLRQAQHTFPLVEWTNLHPPETFSFSACQVQYGHRFYQGWVYYPHPETKRTHFQDPGLVEVITQFIPALGYGSMVQVALNAHEIEVIGPAGDGVLEKE